MSPASPQEGNPHDLLGQLVGAWEGTTRTWFQPGQLADESPTRGRFRPLLDGRFVLYEYEGSLLGEALRGMAFYGFHQESGRFQSAWIDNRHMGTGMMWSEGQALEQGFWVLGHYADPDGGPEWGWRTEIEIQGPDRLAVTAYNITPQGQESKAVETVYTRLPAVDER